MPFFFDAAIFANALAGDLALELRKRQQHVEHQTAHAGRGVEGLRDRDKARAGLVKDIDDAGEVGQASGQSIDLVENDDIDPSERDVREQSLEGRALHVPTREAAIVVPVIYLRPAFVTLAGNVGCAGVTLRVEAVELLLEPLLGRLPGIDSAADGAPPIG